MGREHNTHNRLRSLMPAGIAAALGVTALISVSDGLASAAIDPAGQECFALLADSGDAAIVNLTPIRATASGNGQLISSESKANPPVASNVNFDVGSIDPNVAFAQVGSDDQVCFQNSPQATVDLAADHLGTITDTAYTPATTSGAPVRMVDTRDGLGGTTLTPSGQLCFTVIGAPGDAAIVNLTPVRATAIGNGQLISSDNKTNPPVASNVNFDTGSIDPNVAIARIGTDNQVCFQNSNQATVDLIADHLGNIAGSAYTPADPSGAPVRVIDTREPEPDPVPAECAIPQTTSFSTTTAQHLFGLASQAYEIEPGDDGLLNRRLNEIGDPAYFSDEMNCWELVTVFRGGNTAAALFTDTEVIVARNVHTNDLAVSFRGTEGNALDILNDLSAVRTSWQLADGSLESSAVHTGFLAAYRAAQQQLFNVLRANQRADVDGARVFFTGHSLGGALATLASLDLVDDLMEFGYDRNEVVTYTFGAPRSMSERLSNIHNSLVPVTYAIAHPNDLVSHTPTPIDTFTNPYSHVRNMVVLNAEQATASTIIRGDVTVRRNAGDGRDYRACPAPMWVPNLTLSYHARLQYAVWLDPDKIAGLPTVSVRRVKDPLYVPILNPFPIDNLVMEWSSPVVGPCDQVALWNRSSQPSSLSGALRDRWISIDTNGQHTTTLNVDDATWVGYVDMFGKVIAARSFDLEP